MDKIFYLSLICTVTFGRTVQEDHELILSQIRQLDSLSQQILDNATLSIGWSPLRINFTYLYPSQITSTNQTLIDKVLGITQTFFMKHLLVRRQPTPITWNSTYPTTWLGFPISSTIQNLTWDADYVLQYHIKVFLINLETNYLEDYLAYAAPKVIDLATRRPKMGLISVNMAYIDLPLTDSSFETIVSTLIHEITHGLGFISSLYSYFYDSATGMQYTNKNSQIISNITYLQTPRLLQLAQMYFNCSTMSGVQLENQGGTGTADSHFERTLLWKELMTGSLMNGDNVMTDFTFQLYQDMGFYRLAEYNPDTLQGWGQNKGCAFVEKACLGGSFPEFCTNVDSCSFENAGQGICKVSMLSNNCGYEFIVSDKSDCRDASNNRNTTATVNNQYFGYDSICVNGQISSQLTTVQSCYQYQCSADNKMSLIIANKTIPCPQAGPVTLPAGLTGTIMCPANSAFLCTQQNECPSQCNQKGYCTRGTVIYKYKQCTCMVGYSGKGCEQTCSQLRRKEQCVSSCPTGTYLLSAISYCIGCPGNCATCSNYNLCLTCNSGYNLRGGFCDFNSLPTYPQQNTATNTTQQTQSSNSTTNNTQPLNTTTNTTTTTTTTNGTNNTQVNNTLTTPTNTTDSTNNSTNTNTSSTSNSILTKCFSVLFLSLYFI